MTKSSIAIVILAAGLGKRMGGDLPKAVVRTDQKALIEHVFDACLPLAPAKTVVVVGHKREMVEEVVSASAVASKLNISYAHQSDQLGTGHAVKCALPELKGFSGTIIILYADTPLIQADTLQLLARYHAERAATVSIVSFPSNYPNPYGRIVRDRTDGMVRKIVEAKDCSVEEAMIQEANSGIYAVQSEFLVPAIEGLGNSNAQKEYYLTDIVGAAVQAGKPVSALYLHSDEECLGVNTRVELETVNRTLAKRRLENLIDQGVLFADPATVYIDAEVTIEPGAFIGPNVQLKKQTVIHSEARIEGTSIIKGSVIERGCMVKLGCTIEDSFIGAGAQIGPFANVRPGSKIGKDAKVGNFVEIKKSTLHEGAKASHLTYIGDATVGKDANIGAGTITCNYDGYSKFETKIGAGAFIGSNSALVAPVTIGDGATVGAGSTITKDVPPDGLAVTRAETKIVHGWSAKKRERSKTSKA